MLLAADVHTRLLELYPEVLAGRLDEALELIDPEVVDHRGGTQGTHHGIEAWREKWTATAGSDITVTVEQNISQGDISVNRYTIRGPGYAVTGIDMIRVHAGRLVEHWAVLDTTAIEHQTGQDRDTAVSSPPTTPT